MVKLPIDQLAAGQRVARSVLTSSGITLIQPGTELTGPLIGRLRGVGIAEVYVEAAPGIAAGESIPVPTLEEQLEALDRRFSDHEANPLMLELKAVVARQLRQEHETHAGDR